MQCINRIYKSHYAVVIQKRLQTIKLVVSHFLNVSQLINRRQQRMVNIVSLVAAFGS